MKRLVTLSLCFLSVSLFPCTQNLETIYEVNSHQDVIIQFEDAHQIVGDQLIVDYQEKKKFIHQNLVEMVKSSQQRVTNLINKKNYSYQQFFAANSLALFNADQNLLKQILLFSEVKCVSLNAKVQGVSLPKRDNFYLVDEKLEFNQKHIKTYQAWEKFKVKGKGIVIGTQDSGVEVTHPALAKQYRGKSKSGLNHDYNWHDAIKGQLSQWDDNHCGYYSKTPCDDQSHGSHTIGTAVGYGGDGKRIGVAPEAKFIACRNMENLTGSVATYLECFDFFMAPYPVGSSSEKGDPKKAPHILTNSWACPEKEGCDNNSFLKTLQTLKRMGIMVVAASGNDGRCNSINNPALYSDYVVSVGGLNHRYGKIAGFSSMGPSYDGSLSPHLIAPASSVYSSVPMRFGSGYAGHWWSGTSMAAPHVAGAIALMWSMKPELIGKIDLTKKILLNNLDKYPSELNCGGISGSKHPNNDSGYGSLNLLKLLDRVSRVEL
ncbi:S8 family serine peptidase [Bacteriovoracaceae bacterium]|nr:S8 family serine peptidase [Bacteriovoracaceae bacterium]